MILLFIHKLEWCLSRGANHDLQAALSRIHAASHFLSNEMSGTPSHGERVIYQKQGLWKYSENQSSL